MGSDRHRLLDELYARNPTLQTLSAMTSVVAVGDSLRPRLGGVRCRQGVVCANGVECVKGAGGHGWRA